MTNKAIIGQYYPGNSILHKTDPRLKIILSIAFLVLLFVASSFYAYLVITALLALLVVCSGVPFIKILRGLKTILFLLIFTAVINLFMTSGKPIFSLDLRLFTLSITREGLSKTVLVVVRLVYILISTSVLTLTTTPLALTQGIECLLSPLKFFKLPINDLAMMTSIALRFIPTLFEETDKIKKAQLSRGADFYCGNIFKRVKAFVPILIPLFISAFRRADDLANAMEVRCYGYSTERTHLHSLCFTKIDLNISIIFILFATCAILINYTL